MAPATRRPAANALEIIFSERVDERFCVLFGLRLQRRDLHILYEGDDQDFPGPVANHNMNIFALARGRKIRLQRSHCNIKEKPSRTEAMREQDFPGQFVMYVGQPTALPASLNVHCEGWIKTTGYTVENDSHQHCVAFYSLAYQPVSEDAWLMNRP
jgi:hypothetical protein